MRRRVLLATIAAVTAAVILLGVPLAVIGANWAMGQQSQRLRDRMDRLEGSVISAQELAYEYGNPVENMLPARAVARAVSGTEGDIPAFVRITLPDGQTIEGGDPISGPTISVGTMTDMGAAVLVEASAWTARIQAAQIVIGVGLICLLAIGAGAAVAVWQSNRLAKPLVYLAASAEQLGSGQVRPTIEESGIEEIDLVAAELARSSDRLAGNLAAARQFTSDASHQLRTPLTALSMRLEEIMLASGEPDVREEARVSLEQVERLVSVVDDLLAASKRTQGGTTEPVTLLDVASQQQEEWRPTYARAGRKIAVDVSASHRVLATPGALKQVISTLLENSLKYGAGTTTISSRPSGTTGAVAIEIGDEGEGVSDEVAGSIFERGFSTGRSTGLGLALARDLVSADGGRVELAQRRPAVFRIFLAGVPRTLQAGSVLPAGASISSRGTNGRRR